MSEGIIELDNTISKNDKDKKIRDKINDLAKHLIGLNKKGDDKVSVPEFKKSFSLDYVIDIIEYKKENWNIYLKALMNHAKKQSDDKEWIRQEALSVFRIFLGHFEVNFKEMVLKDEVIQEIKRDKQRLLKIIENSKNVQLVLSDNKLLVENKEQELKEEVEEKPKQKKKTSKDYNHGNTKF